MFSESDSAEQLSATADTSWMNAETVDVSDGYVYSEWLDIKNGDANTKMFVFNPAKNVKRVTMTMHIGTWFANTYKVAVHVYDKILGWGTTEHTLVFSLFGGQDKVMYEGSATNMSKLCVTFLKDGSTGEKEFEYKMYTSVTYNT